MEFNQREQIIALTAQWSGERFEDGRPRVPDSLLEALRGMTLEEIWMPLYLKGYVFQYAGGLQTLHPGKKLVGRAVTCTFVPTRPDLAAVVKSEGKAHGWQGAGNQWVVDCLTEGDVIVADMFDKVYNGTFVGGNLTTAIAAKTKTGGAVIWGGVRDLEQMEKIHAVQVYYRGVDPTPIRECVAVGINTPCRINQAICLEMWYLVQLAACCLSPAIWYSMPLMRHIRAMPKMHLALLCYAKDVTPPHRLTVVCGAHRCWMIWMISLRMMQRVLLIGGLIGAWSARQPREIR